MTQKQLQQLKLYFAIVLNYGDNNAIKELFANLGYDVTKTKINVNLCLKALQEWGNEFAVPFNKIGRKTAESPKFQLALKAYAQNTLSKANGDKWKPTEQQTDSIIKGSFDTLNTVLGGVFGTIQSKDAEKNSQAKTEEVNAYMELLKQQANNSQNSNSNTNWILIGGGALLVVVLIIVLVVVLGKK